MLIYLIRHGETAWNAVRKYQGSVDLSLSPEGAAALHRADFSPEKVYVSPLLRAKQTAAILFPDAPQVEVDGLREMCFGDFEGRSPDEMEHDPAFRAWVDGDCVAPCPNGESREEFTARSAAVFERLVDEALERGEETLVIVAHGGTQMALMEKYVRPQAPYYTWLAGNGKGYLLDAGHWRERRELALLERLSYRRA